MSPKKELKVTSPYSQQLLDTLPLMTCQEVLHIIKQAKACVLNKSAQLLAVQRKEILLNLADRVKAQSERFAHLIAQEGGKPLMDAQVEVSRAIEGILWAAHHIGDIKGTEIPMGLTQASLHRKAFTFREPIGVVLAISAFNHPLNLIVHQVIPAIAVGCPVVVKPASATPLSCIKLVECLYQSGLDPKWCQVIVCPPEVAQEAVCSPDIDFLSFIGSAKVGWALKKQLAPGVRCAMEHGGVAPVIVDKGVDLESIIPVLSKGAFYHAGQVCVSVQRVFCVGDFAPKLAQLLAQQAHTLKVGDPDLPDTQVGPLIFEKEVQRVDQWVQEAIQGGAQCLCGGTPLPNQCYAPTVLLDPSFQAKVSQQEVFGPVVCVYSCQTLQQAIAHANALDYAFQGAVFSHHMPFIMDVVEQLDATAVMVNDHSAFRVDWMPFGGRRHSGFGLGGIGYSMHDFTQEKMMVLNLS